MVIINAYLHGMGRKPIVDAEVETRLTLCDEVDARMSYSRVRNQTSHYGGLSHSPLLEAFPAVRMREHELDRVLDRVPQALSICVSLRNEATSACKEVVEEVSEDVDDGLLGR